MALIDEVVSVDLSKGTIVAAFAARREWSENWAAIEYMAQAAAALVGAADRAKGYSGAPRPGFLLGTRRLELSLARFEPGKRYEARAKSVFADADSASFECEIADGAVIVARATLNAFRPPDAAAFLEGQRA
jgi:predicted hotdog family 3-hydroxylacyl-ACP dehydratase